MVHDVVMPKLSDSMEEGVVLRWLKQVGEAVAAGEELVEIETDKANMAYEAEVAGQLISIRVGESEAAPIGAVIGQIADDGEAAPDPGAAAAPAADSEPDRSSPLDQRQPDDERVYGSRAKASPVARRFAAANGIELASVTGSGPLGRVLKADVRSALEGGSPAAPTAPPPAPAATPGPAESAKGELTVVEPTRLQASAARRMAESKATVPHFYLTAEIEMGCAVAARAALKAGAAAGDPVPSLNDMVVKACALALREHPRVNGAFRDGRFELYSRVNVGVAVAGPEALVVPTVFDADRKGLAAIASETRALAAGVRNGSITPPELSGGTFTVSNLGMYGVAEFGAIVNPPQAAILAVGAVAERPVVRAGKVVAAQTMRATLSCDHRILYGAAAAEFLARIRALLEEPLSLAL